MEINFNWDWVELHDAFFSKEKYVSIRSGRGTGKTYGAFEWILEDLFCIKEVQSGLWFDTVQNNIDSYVEQYLESDLLKDVWKHCRYHTKRKRLELPNNKFIQFASSEEPKNAEGFRYHRTVLNEGGLILKNASLWNNTIEPMTNPRDGVANKTRIVGTPKGKNTFHKLCSLNDPDWQSYHFTIHNSPRYNINEIESIQRRTPLEVWRQEYLAEFLDDSSSVFRKFNECVSDIQYDQPKKGMTYVMSVDLGKHQDFTVIYVAELEFKRVIFQDRFNQIDWLFQKRRILNIYKVFKVQEVILDSSGVGDAIYDDLVQAGMVVRGFKFTNPSKNLIVQNLSIAIENHEIQFYGWVELLNELGIFEYEISATGTIRYNAPDGFHDDCVISLALLNDLLRDPIVDPFSLLASA